MEIEIDDRRGQIFHGGEALIEIARGDEPLQQLLRHRRAGLIMPRETPQNVRLFEPMLVELRGQFDEIGGDVGAGNPGIGDAERRPCSA